MKMYRVLSLVIISAMFVAACGTMGMRMETRVGAGADRGDARSFPGMSNNTRIELEAETYRAPEITHNSVVIAGAGTDRTVIIGTLVISGNNARLSNLTIDGDVTITANNADLRDARITGSVNDRGRNNEW